MSVREGGAARPQGTEEEGMEGAWTRPLPRRQVLLTMGGVMMALFLASLDQTIVATAMPRIIADLEGFDRFTWVTTAYLVASTTVVPIVGRLTDMYGRKWFYIAGIAVFLLGSALAGLSETMTQLIIFRGLQGVGGGTMMAGAFIAVGDLFPPEERGKNQGLLGGVFGLSSVIGPTLGGVVTDHLSWHWIFYINLPLGVPVVGLFIAYFPQSSPSGGRQQLDYLGIATLVLAVVPLLLALSWGGVQYQWGSAQIVGLLAFAALAAAGFVATESRVADPVIPLSLFRYPVVSVSLLVVFLTGFGMFGGIIFIPLFFQAVLGASATSSGNFLTPMMLGVVAGGIISGQALSRLGGHYRLQGLTGLAIMAVGIFLLSRMTATTSYGQAVANIVLMGVGLGVTFPVYTLVVQNTVPYQVLGLATSSVQFFRSIGGTLGLAVLGAVMTSRFAAELAKVVPAGVKEVVPQEQLAYLAENPQALLSPEARVQLEAEFAPFGAQGAGLLEQLLDALKQALSTAIGEVFLISLVVVAVAWVATLLLRPAPTEQKTVGTKQGGTVVGQNGAPRRG